VAVVYPHIVHRTAKVDNKPRGQLSMDKRCFLMISEAYVLLSNFTMLCYFH
jgi:hypothetical protein